MGFPARGVCAALALALILASPARASKLGGFLRAQRSAAVGGIAVAGAVAAEPSFRVLIKVSSGTTIDSLRVAYPRARFRAAAGSIVTATVPDSTLRAFEADARVVYADAVRRVHPTLDVARGNATSGGLYLGVTRNAAATDLSQATGAGVIVGIVDSGIDFRHADFRFPGSTNSRILYLWDQTDTVGPPPDFNALGFACSNANGGLDDDCLSTEWNQLQLSNTIAGAGPVRQTDSSGHGTHVAGIAAGNGLGGSSPGTYVGLAPEADIIFVKTAFYEDEIIDGVKYIVARAALLGKPAVINLSVGSQLDPHDGTSPFDEAIGNLAANTPIVVSMGNDGTGTTGVFPHAQADVMGYNQTIAFNLTVNTSGNWAQAVFWSGSPSSPSQATYAASISVNGTNCGSQTNGAGTDTDPATPLGYFSCAGQRVYLFNNNGAVGIAGGDTNAAGNREIYASVHNPGGLPATTFPVVISLTCTNPSGCGRLDGFVSRSGEGVNFAGGSGYSRPATLTMSAPATANNVIAVGSYAGKSTWNPGDGYIYHYNYSSLGDISDFSGWGPTRDGRAKPDVAAPGDVIASALSSQAVLGAGQTFDNRPGVFNQILPDGAHAILAGTSMAAPLVTGILATRLQGAPARTVEQLRAIVQGLARSDSAVAGLGSNAQHAFGAGKVVASPQPIAPASGLQGTALGVSSISWTWNSTTLSADAYNLYVAGVPLATAVQPPYVQTGLTANADQSASLYGEGGGIEGPAAFSLSATLALPPAGAPTAIPFVSSAVLTYAAYPAAPAASSCFGYEIQLSTAANFSGTILSSATPARTLTTLIVTGLSASTSYYARLGALNSQGVAHYGPSAVFRTLHSLFPPAGLSASAISTGSMRLSWTQGLNPPDLTYLAQASTAPDYGGSLDVSTGGYAVAFTGLSANTSYYLRVQVLSGPLASMGPVATLARPPVPVAVSFGTIDDTSLAVAWGANGNPPGTLYQAEVSPASDFSSTVVSSSTRNTWATLIGLAPNTTYYARARARSHGGVLTSDASLGSTATWVRTPTLPSQPFSGQATDGFSFGFNDGGNPAGTRYLVRVSTLPDFSTLAASSSTVGTTASFAGLLSNQLYHVQVAGLNRFDAATAFTAPAATATLVLAPQAVAVGVSTRSGTAFGAAWARGALAVGTQYHAQVSSSALFDFVGQSSVTAGLSALFEGLDSNTTYFVRVQALSLNPPTPDSAFLAAAAGSTLAKAPVPDASPFPGVFFTSIAVSWTPLALAPSSCAAGGYLVQLSTAADFSATIFSTQTPTGASVATVAGLSYATRYYARVGALNWEGLPAFLVVGSTVTGVPHLSSGTVSDAGLSLFLAAAFPQIPLVRLEVPPGVFPVGTPVGMTAEMPGTLAAAGSNEAGVLPISDGVGFQLAAAGLQPAKPVRMTLIYEPLLLPAGQDARRLHLMRYDTSSGQWTLVASQTDVRSGVLTSVIAHFSYFAPFFVAAGLEPSATKVFPQPWEIGDPSSAYGASALTFSSLPSGARVRLFTLTGELLWEATAPVSGVLAWDGGTRFGGKAASGSYYALIEAGASKHVRRVVIIR